MTTPAPSQPDPAASRIQSDLARGLELIDKAAPEVMAGFTPGSERPVSDTPRTDAEDCDDWTPGVSLVPSDFARELEREAADYKAHFEACERRRMLTAEERDQARDDLRTARRALAAERTLAAQARELLSDSATPFDAGCALLLQIPEGGV